MRMFPPFMFCLSSYLGSIPSLNMHWPWICAVTSLATPSYLVLLGRYLRISGIGPDDDLLVSVIEHIPMT